MISWCIAQGTISSHLWWSIMQDNMRKIMYMYDWVNLPYSRKLTKHCKSTIIGKNLKNKRTWMKTIITHCSFRRDFFFFFFFLDVIMACRSSWARDWTWVTAMTVSHSNDNAKSLTIRPSGSSKSSYFNPKRVEGIILEWKWFDIVSFIKSQNFVFVFVFLLPVPENFILDCHQRFNLLLGATPLVQPSLDACFSKDFCQGIFHLYLNTSSEVELITYKNKPFCLWTALLNFLFHVKLKLLYL